MLFTARIIPGSGTARMQNVPTLNLSLDDVPPELAEGIYACHVSNEQTIKPANQQTWIPAVMHFGPRPVHDLPLSCEIHLLDETVNVPPASVDVLIVKRIRDVKNFESSDQLKAAIQNDITSARAILSENC